MMFCTKCGSENNDSGTFCSKCGAPLKPKVAIATDSTATKSSGAQVSSTAQDSSDSQKVAYGVGSTPYSRYNANGASTQASAVTAAAQKPKKKKAPLIIAIIAALLLIAAGIFFVPKFFGCSVFGGGAFEMQTAEILPITPDDETKFYINGKVIDAAVDGHPSYSSQSSDGTKMLFTDENDTAHVVTEKGITKVADDTFRAVISPDGSNVVFVDEDGMHMVSSAGGDVTDITDETDIGSIIFSQDGKTIVFDVYTNNELMVYSGGKLVSIDEDLSPISVSNGGNYIYCYDSDNLYCANMKGDKTEISSDFYSYYYQANIASTELLFVTDDGLFYVSKNGEAKEVDDGLDSLRLLYPDKATGRVASVKNHVYYDGEDLVYIDGSLNCDRIENNVDYASIADDGKTVLYVKGSKLYRAAAKANSKAEELADDVEYNFGHSKDAKHIYYISEDDGGLYYVSKAGDSVRIESDISSDAFKVTDDGQCYYVLTDGASAGPSASSSYSNTGTLYCSNRGAEPKEISDDVYFNLHAFGNFIYYSIGERSDEVYFIEGSKEPVKMD